MLERAHRWLSGEIRRQLLVLLCQAQGATLQTWDAQSDFTGCFPANSHERSAQTGIGLGRTLVRIGRCWAALRTSLLSMALGPFSPRACCGRQEIARKRCCPTGAANAVERSGSRFEGQVAAGRVPPSFGKMGCPRMGMISFWAGRFISLRGLSEAPGGAVGACLVGR